AAGNIPRIGGIRRVADLERLVSYREKAKRVRRKAGRRRIGKFATDRSIARTVVRDDIEGVTRLERVTRVEKGERENRAGDVDREGPPPLRRVRRDHHLAIGGTRTVIDPAQTDREDAAGSQGEIAVYRNNAGPEVQACERTVRVISRRQSAARLNGEGSRG